MTLIERIEAATGLDRELDALIEVENRRYSAIALGLNDGQRAKWMPFSNGRVADEATSYYAPDFTFSIDTALTQMPDGMPWRIEFDGDLYYVELRKPHERVFTGGRTAPLAICAAALNAREDNA